MESNSKSSDGGLWPTGVLFWGHGFVTAGIVLIYVFGSQHSLSPSRSTLSYDTQPVMHHASAFQHRAGRQAELV